MSVLQKILLGLIKVGRKISEAIGNIRNKETIPADYETADDPETVETQFTDDDGETEGEEGYETDPYGGYEYDPDAEDGRQLPSVVENVTRTIRGLPKLHLAIICGVLFIIIIIIASGGSGSSSKSKENTENNTRTEMEGDIDLADYLAVTFSGYNGYGTASATFDKAALLYDLTGLDVESTEEGGGSVRLTDENYEAAVEFYDSVTWQLSQDSGLANGDAVTVTLSCSEKAASSLGITAISGGVVYAVSGLLDLTEENILADVELTVSGYYPAASVSVTWTDGTQWSDLGGLSVSPSTGLSDGDTVTITLSDDVAEKIAGTYGITASSLEASKTVSGAGSYLTSVSDLPDSMLEQIYSHADSIFRERAASWDDGVTAGTSELVGIYLASPTDSAAYGTEHASILYAAMAVTADVARGNGETISYYVCVPFYDMAILDGSLLCDWTDTEGCMGSWTTPQAVEGIGGKLTFSGYSSMDYVSAAVEDSIGNSRTVKYVEVSVTSEEETEEATEETESTESTEDTEEITESTEETTGAEAGNVDGTETESEAENTSASGTDTVSSGFSGTAGA